MATPKKAKKVIVEGGVILVKKPEERKKDMHYYLTLFKIEKHTTWRAHLGGAVDSFQKQLNGCGGVPPKVTEKATYKIDRINGSLQML